jgi:hypothetical protein
VMWCVMTTMENYIFLFTQKLSLLVKTTTTNNWSRLHIYHLTCCSLQAILWKQKRNAFFGYICGIVTFKS